MTSPIYVTRPDLPALEKFIPYLRRIWASRTLTNGGEFHQQLENELCSYLGVKYLSLCSNGTLGLMIALQALGIAGEVITTPYSFVATAHSLLWNRIQPVFVDIDPNTLNIDPKKIEEAITERTSAILAVHCYGRPCDVNAIKQIADRHGLKVIYDAAHAFGVQDEQGSILKHGDLSVVSFHATKVFHTFEGGAIVCSDEKTKQHIDNLKNFGFVNETTVVEAGINGKMSEINAAFGLLELTRIEALLAKRRVIDSTYRRGLQHIPGICCLSLSEKITSNCSYFPILIDENYPLSRDALYSKLHENRIFSRRYFYPLISNFPMYQNMDSATGSNLPWANMAAAQILCLPIFPDLCTQDIERIIRLIHEV